MVTLGKARLYMAPLTAPGILVWDVEMGWGKGNRMGVKDYVSNFDKPSTRGLVPATNLGFVNDHARG